MKKIGYAALAFAMPLFAAAQANVTNLGGILNFITRLINAVLPIIVALAVVYFVWGMFMVITAKDEEKKAKAKSTVIYGVIAIFVMVSVWGLVNILVNTFNLNQTKQNPLQSLPTLPSTF